MTKTTEHKSSTSALAKALGVSSQLLFTTFKDYGWIRKVDDGWELTAKGEFEGGEYVHSKKYGRYIVWPNELTAHPLLQALEDSKHISATVLGKSYGLNARQVNRLLAELAWIKHTFQGWELTALGEHHGGVQLENESSGTFYIVWPESIQHDATLLRQLRMASEANTVATDSGDDLFAECQHYTAVDGHQHSSMALLKVCHWLYMAGMAHACHRQLPVEEPLYADFYLPAYQLYIECWGSESNSGDLADKLKRKDYYQKLGLTAIDLEYDDFEHLDDVLTRQFRKLGIRIYP